MPFTPFHMGPGILIKALLQGSFSLMVFGWAQIIMDIQPLVVLLTGEGHLHGFSHTYLGASLLVILAALSGKYLGEFGLLLLRMESLRGIHISWPVAAVSALIGTFSHVLLDSLMHGDLLPFAPWSDNNPFLHWMTIKQLHQLCLSCGVVGGILFWCIVLIKNHRHE
ncbi:hypothetical protein P886_2474 [Alteromonadaceae bacterium 2753L.S.0a.02]|nr:hypothetical protein P886_2474 [Alteromonadaceae bacterium 2753L.S.0a.02]